MVRVLGDWVTVETGGMADGVRSIGTSIGVGVDKDALFALFYQGAAKVLVAPEYAGKDIKEALRFGSVTVVINE